MLLAVGLIVGGFLIAAAPAVAQDPSTGSPPGTLYRLPVDSGRADAAPRDGAGGGSGSDVPASTFRSENNFGSSAIVPGAPSKVKGADGDAEGSSGADGSASGAALTAEALDTGDTDAGPAYLLLVMIVAIGGFLGWLASRAGRRAAS